MRCKAPFFFCGDQRREELPERLHEKGIALQEILVYKTVSTPKKVEKRYDAILFFSPSAVKGFFSQNTVPADCTLFAIGGTTADCIRQHSSNRLIISNVSEKEALIKNAITYFT
jgi:uroporphyrinogen-III synthase